MRMQIRAVLGTRLRIASPLILLASLSACAQSPFSGYAAASPDTEQAIVAAAAHDRLYYSAMASAQVAIVQNPDINGGRLSPQAFMKIQEYNISCQHQVSPQLSGPVQSFVGSAVPYGAAGTVGTGVGAHAAFGAAATVGTYGLYGGLTELGLGGVNGIITGSYAMASAVGTCTRDFWDDVVHTSPLFAGAHVEVVYYGKRWGDSAPPALSRPVGYGPAVSAPGGPVSGPGETRPAVTYTPLPPPSDLTRP